MNHTLSRPKIILHYRQAFAAPMMHKVQSLPPVRFQKGQLATHRAARPSLSPSAADLFRLLLVTQGLGQGWADSLSHFQAHGTLQGISHKLSASNRPEKHLSITSTEHHFDKNLRIERNKRIVGFARVVC
jgi:hypothetical protein